MSYEGVKFRVKIISKKLPKDPRIKELKHRCGEFHRYNLAPPYEGGSYGNLSFRLQNGKDSFVITGSRIGLKNALTDDCFVKVSSVNLRKGIIYAHGTRKPSSESMLHFAIYHQKKDVNAILHGHSQEILFCAKKLKIPKTRQEEPYGTIELVQRVLEILDDESFLIMKNHGFISLGKTIEEAGELVLQIYRKCL